MPFRPSTPADTLSAILHDDPPELPRAAAIALSLERILRHCLEKTPEERFQNVRDVIFDLEALPRAAWAAEQHICDCSCWIRLPSAALRPTDGFGHSLFTRSCAQCRGGVLHPSGSTPDAGIPRPIRARYHNIQTACPRPTTDGFAPGPPRLARNARIYRITLADGSYQFVNTTSKPMVDTPKRGQAQNRAGASIQ